MASFPINDVILTLIGAGGAGGLVGLANFIGKIRTGKMESEDRLINRLNEDNKRQNDRADAAEARADLLLAQRNKAWVQATQYYALLRSSSIEPGEKLVTFDGE